MFTDTVSSVRASDDPLVKKAVVSKHFLVSDRTVDQWRVRELIPFYQVNARVFRFRISEVERALQRMRVGGEK